MKTRRIPSAIPIYFASVVWILYGLALPLYKITHILMAIALSGAVYLVTGKFFPGRTVEAAPDSGDAQIDAEIKANLDDLKKIENASATIRSAAVKQKIERIEKAGRQILSAVAEKPDRASQVRKFMKYFLPTTSKLIDSYGAFTQMGAQGDNIAKATSSIENSLDMIASAFEKQLDTLYRDDALDITSDIQVLETMMAGAGLTGAGIRQATKEEQK